MHGVIGNITVFEKFKRDKSNIDIGVALQALLQTKQRKI
jgi:hypothetical protein